MKSKVEILKPLGIIGLMTLVFGLYVYAMVEGHVEKRGHIASAAETPIRFWFTIVAGVTCLGVCWFAVIKRLMSPASAVEPEVINKVSDHLPVDNSTAGR